MPKNLAILFLNLGGPETLNDVKPFLYRLFKDPDIIRIPFAPLRNLVAWLIATLREKKSTRLYADIGGGSPIRRYTDAQALAVQNLLQKENHPAFVRTAFTASPPLVEDVVKDLYEQGVTRFLAFPLYPQYSTTTTRGSLKRAAASVKKYAPNADLYEIQSWQTHPLFLKAHAERIQEQLGNFSDPNPEHIHLLFSAHSIPEKLVTKEGDPYKKQVEESAFAVVRTLEWKGPWSLAWQSRLGPVKWLEPSTPDVIRQLGAKGVRQVLIDPIAFVSDHIETLNEIDIEFAELAHQSGIKDFHKAEGLNTHSTFIQALTDIVMKKNEFWKS